METNLHNTPRMWLINEAQQKQMPKNMQLHVALYLCLLLLRIPWYLIIIVIHAGPKMSLSNISLKYSEENLGPWGHLKDREILDWNM